MRLPLLCALAALALLAGATAANATPAHRDAVLSSTDAWLSEVLHVPISVRADMAGAPGELKAETGFVRCGEPGVARYDPYLLTAAGNRHALDFETAYNIALHEHLHLRGGPCVYVAGSFEILDPEWAFYEEGFVDANRADMFPAFFFRMFGRRARGDWTAPMSMYAANVTQVRALSVAATGSRSWRDRAAVLWRRAGLLAAWPERQALIAEAVS